MESLVRRWALALLLLLLASPAGAVRWPFADGGRDHQQSLTYSDASAADENYPDIEVMYDGSLIECHLVIRGNGAHQYADDVICSRGTVNADGTVTWAAAVSVVGDAVLDATADKPFGLSRLQAPNPLNGSDNANIIVVGYIDDASGDDVIAKWAAVSKGGTDYSSTTAGTLVSYNGSAWVSGFSAAFTIASTTTPLDLDCDELGPEGTPNTRFVCMWQDDGITSPNADPAQAVVCDVLPSRGATAFACGSVWTDNGATTNFWNRLDSSSNTSFVAHQANLFFVQRVPGVGHFSVATGACSTASNCAITEDAGYLSYISLNAHNRLAVCTSRNAENIFAVATDETTERFAYSAAKWTGSAWSSSTPAALPGPGGDTEQATGSECVFTADDTVLIAYMGDESQGGSSDANDRFHTYWTLQQCKVNWTPSPPTVDCSLPWTSIGGLTDYVIGDNPAWFGKPNLVLLSGYGTSLGRFAVLSQSRTQNNPNSASERLFYATGYTRPTPADGAVLFSTGFQHGYKGNSTEWQDDPLTFWTIGQNTGTSGSGDFYTYSTDVPTGQSGNTRSLRVDNAAFVYPNANAYRGETFPPVDAAKVAWWMKVLRWNGSNTGRLVDLRDSSGKIMAAARYNPGTQQIVAYAGNQRTVCRESLNDWTPCTPSECDGDSGDNCECKVESQGGQETNIPRCLDSVVAVANVSSGWGQTPGGDQVNAFSLTAAKYQEHGRTVDLRRQGISYGSANVPLGICNGGTLDGDACSQDANCTGGGDCAARRICSGGTRAGKTCTDLITCPSGSCVADTDFAVNPIDRFTVGLDDGLVSTERTVQYLLDNLVVTAGTTGTDYARVAPIGATGATIVEAATCNTAGSPVSACLDDSTTGTTAPADGDYVPINNALAGSIDDTDRVEVGVGDITLGTGETVAGLTFVPSWDNSDTPITFGNNVLAGLRANSIETTQQCGVTANTTSAYAGCLQAWPQAPGGTAWTSTFVNAIQAVLRRSGRHQTAIINSTYKRRLHDVLFEVAIDLPDLVLPDSLQDFNGDGEVTVAWVNDSRWHNTSWNSAMVAMLTDLSVDNVYACATGGSQLQNYTTKTCSNNQDLFCDIDADCGGGNTCQMQIERVLAGLEKNGYYGCWDSLRGTAFGKPVDYLFMEGGWINNAARTPAYPGSTAAMPSGYCFNPGNPDHGAECENAKGRDETYGFTPANTKLYCVNQQALGERCDIVGRPSFMRCLSTAPSHAGWLCNGNRCSAGSNEGGTCTDDGDCPSGTCQLAEPFFGANYLFCGGTPSSPQCGARCPGRCSVTTSTFCGRDGDCPGGETCEGEEPGQLQSNVCDPAQTVDLGSGANQNGRWCMAGTIDGLGCEGVCLAAVNDAWQQHEMAKVLDLVEARNTDGPASNNVFAIFDFPYKALPGASGGICWGGGNDKMIGLSQWLRGEIERRRTAGATWLGWTDSTTYFDASCDHRDIGYCLASGAGGTVPDGIHLNDGTGLNARGKSSARAGVDVGVSLLEACTRNRCYEQAYPCDCFQCNPLLGDYKGCTYYESFEGTGTPLGWTNRTGSGENYDATCLNGQCLSLGNSNYVQWDPQGGQHGNGGRWYYGGTIRQLTAGTGSYGTVVELDENATAPQNEPQVEVRDCTSGVCRLRLKCGGGSPVYSNPSGTYDLAAAGRRFFIEHNAATTGARMCMDNGAGAWDCGSTVTGCTGAAPTHMVLENNGEGAGNVRFDDVWISAAPPVGAP